MMKILVYLLLSASYIIAKTIISLNDVNIQEMEKIYKYGSATSTFIFDGDKIWISGKHYIYNIDKQGNVIQYFGRGEKNKFRHSLALDVIGTSVITKDMYNGRNYIMILNNYGGRLKKTKLHHYRTIDGIKVVQDSSIIILGQYYTKYAEWLDRYDENSNNPSIESINKFREFYNTQTAYTLTKYDFNLSIVDSANFTKRKGQNMEGYSSLFLREVIGLDDLDNIYTVHKSQNYKIRKYSSEFELLYEFEGFNEHFKPIPDKLTEAKAERMRNVPGTFSNIYSINVINDTIVTSFYQNPKNWDIPSPPFYYDIFNQEGEKLHTGTIPYRIFTKDGENNLYFMVKKDGAWFFGKDQYYLVSFTLNDLLNSSVNEDWVDNAIQEYLDEK